MKQTFLITLMVLMATMSFCQVNNGLIAKYSFNAGNANDEINTNNGIVNGATLTADRFGNTDKAYCFDGVDDYINFGNAPEFQMGVNDFSISIWVYYDTVQSSFIFGKREGPSTNYSQYSLAIFANPFSPTPSYDSWMFLRSNGADDRSVSMGDLSGMWHHILLVHEYGSRTAIYIDGNFHGEDPNPVLGGFSVSSQPLVAGYFSESNSFYFKGKMDDIRIYNRALNALEADSLYNEVDPMIVAINEVFSIEESIQIYPNPTTGKLTLSEKYHLVLTDLTGKILLTKQYANSLDIAAYPAGMYFLALSDEEGKLLQRSKILKE